MRVRWNGNTYLMTWICVFGNVRIRARWIGPYAWRIVRCAFHGVFRGYFRVFATHSQSVQNAFTECSQRVRYLCVTYSPCKSMVFSVQKGGFCIAKVWFLFFECCVVAICLECYHNPFAAKWQSVSNILAIRQQHFGNPSAMFWQTVRNILAISQQP